MKKKCAKCGKKKDESEFNSQRGKVKKNQCKTCQKEWWKAWYAKHRVREVLRSRVNKNKRRKHLRELLIVLKNRPCADCGKRYPSWQMDFDHRDGTSKKDNLAHMAFDAVSDATFLREARKCDVVCCLCHRHRTYIRSHPEWKNDLKKWKTLPP